MGECLPSTSKSKPEEVLPNTMLPFDWELDETALCPSLQRALKKGETLSGSLNCNLMDVVYEQMTRYTM